MANSLEELFGKEWVDSVITSADSKHPLALWHKKNPDNPVVGYVSRLAEFILKGGMVKCDSTRLTSKLRADFAETLTEMDYSVFLGEQGFQVMMEPCWPKAGPDLVAAREDEYFVEIRNVGLGEARAAADAATIELFDRLGELGSRFAIIVSMTDEFGAYSPELKKAAKKVAQVLKELTEKHIKKASLYYYGPDDSTLVEGERAEPKFDLTDKGKLKAQLDQLERIQKAPFVARFEDTGTEKDRTAVAVHPLGADPRILQPDRTHLRLRGILHQKREQPSACISSHPGDADCRD